MSLAWQEQTATLTSRAPAAAVVCAAMGGILADRLGGVPTSFWWALLAFAIAGGFGLLRSPRASSLVVLGGWMALFGLWHQVWWSEPPADDVFHVATDAGLPVDLQGRVLQPSWQSTMTDGEPQTLAIVACESLQQADESRPVAGTVRLQILRTIHPLRAGAVIRVIGRLQRPPVALNPDGFDYREWLRMRGVTALLKVDSADAVVIEGERPTIWNRLQNSRHELRESAVAALQQTSHPETAAIGEALLLGSRNRLPDEIREAFAESGVLHVLAISGVNVAVIWLGLIHACRAFGFSLTTSSWAVIGGLVGYAWLTDANPPIVRAATFAIVLQSAELSGRRMGLLQGLSLAALAVLALNPTDLFNPGAQLSFLSVAVLSAVNRWSDEWQAREAEDADTLQSPLQRWGRTLLAGFWRANLTTGAVWLATAPLVAWRFHLVSLVGLGLNVLLGPWVLLLLWTGYLWLVTFLIYPAAAGLLLSVFEMLLQGLFWLTELASRWSYGHWYLPGPPGWWIAGFYLLVVAAFLTRSVWSPGKQMGTLLLWTNLGLAWGLLPSGTHGLTCEMIAVGHGLTMVIHCPNGRTLGYDVGCLAGGDYAAAALCNSVWNAGSRRLDALLVSHADIDHCNGIAPVTERLQVGTLCAHRTLVTDESDVAMQSLDAWSRRGGPIVLVSAGDQIRIDPEVTVTVWQPAGGVRYSRDNANSLVVLVEYAGRSLLLTGDLERDGLAALLARPRTPVDVLVAPHHGSRAANPPELAAWTNPAVVIASSADRRVTPRLQDSYRNASLVLNTAESGAIRCEISPQGDLRVQPFHPPDLPESPVAVQRWLSGTTEWPFETAGLRGLFAGADRP